MKCAVFILICAISILGIKVFADDCDDEFIKGQFQTHVNCVVDCETSPWADVSDWICKRRCEDNCEKYKNKPKPVPQPRSDSAMRVVKLYPGLSNNEKKIAEEDPLRAWKAYKLSWKAESTCHEIYGRSATDDESDACRHFIWSGLMVKELGSEFAKKVLDAHEDETIDTPESKNMDLHNNKI